VQRMPTLQLCDAPIEWRDVIAVRGLKALQVAI
jgi:hypothetical protein